jgi:UDP-N-acetylglucosamine--N-acetylmuramyl-(pentapeptide) pyrophosphoryl-undecaprenol N-acetylglucosamine transferase
VIAVTGGSLGARRLNDGALGLAELLASRSDLLIYHVCGARDFATLERRVAASPQIRPGNYRLVAFEQHLPELFCAADLVICRAGASTIAELCTLGTPSVLVPLPNAPGDHQLHNAESLVHVGGSRLVVDGDATPQRLAQEVIELIDEPTRLEEMGVAAKSLSHREAAREIADLVISTIGTPTHGTAPADHDARGSAA